LEEKQTIIQGRIWAGLFPRFDISSAGTVLVNKFGVDKNKQPPQYKLLMADFGPELRKLRIEKKIGMKRLARDLGISYTYISHIERGKTLPSETLIRKLAAYFSVNAEDLLLAAGKFPQDIEELLDKHPREVVMVLRESFASYKRESHA
jgi:transcriptional regulator with XRE-family HTH domain